MNRIYITFFFLGFFTLFLACKQNNAASKKDNSDIVSKTISFEFEHQIRPSNLDSKSKVPLLVLMHGLGSNEMDLFALGKNLDPRYMVVSVRAPHKIGEGKYSWYDLKRGQGKWDYSIEELKESRTKFIKFIKQLTTKYSIDNTKIYIGGFSQGANMSFATALNHSDLIDGAMILSGDLLDEVEAEVLGVKNFNDLNIYMSHGRKDAVLSFAEAEKDAKVLESLDINFEKHWFDSAHTISQENYMSMNAWLVKQLSVKN